MGFGIKELLIILVIVIVLFGTSRLKGIGTDLGSAIKGFRKSINDEDAEPDSENKPGLEQEQSHSGEKSGQDSANKEKSSSDNKTS